MADSLSNSWKPLNDNHAIDVMAAVVSFSEPVPALTLAKMVRAAEPVAFDLGLRSRQARRGVQLQVTPHGITAGQSTGPEEGVILASFVDGVSGSLAKPAEHIQIDAMTVVFRTWRYVSWSQVLPRLLTLIEAAVKVASPVVSPSAVRLEFLDRFYDDSGQRLNAKALLRQESRFIPPDLVQSDDLWHCHSGQFISGPNGRRLRQVNLDAVEGPSPANKAAKFINVTTALEDRYSSDIELASIDLSEVLTSMQKDLKRILHQIITPEMSAKIGLGQE